MDTILFIKSGTFVAVMDFAVMDIAVMDVAVTDCWTLHCDHISFTTIILKGAIRDYMFVQQTMEVKKKFWKSICSF